MWFSGGRLALGIFKGFKFNHRFWRVGGGKYYFLTGI